MPCFELFLQLNGSHFLGLEFQPDPARCFIAILERKTHNRMLYLNLHMMLSIFQLILIPD